MLRIFELFPTSDHQLLTAEEQCDDRRLIEAIDESWKLLGLLLDILEAQPDRDHVQIERMAEIRA